MKHLELLLIFYLLLLLRKLSFRQEIKRQTISDKRDESVNQDTKDDELDENNYSLDDLPPYTPTIQTHSSKLHDSSKTFSRSLTTLTRKRKK